MSHRITVEGNFGSSQCLKDVLRERNIRFNESKRGNDEVLTFPDHTRYGNPLEINVTNPRASTMDSDLGRMVREWYRDSMARHVEQELLMHGHTVQAKNTVGQNIVLRVAVG